jgi:hypothetical protein
MRRVFAQKPALPTSQERATRSTCRALRGTSRGRPPGSPGIWRCFNVVGGLLSWIAGRRGALADLDERAVEQYLRHRAGKQSIQPGDRSALKRWLSVLREEGAIAPVVLPPGSGAKGRHQWAMMGSGSKEVRRRSSWWTLKWFRRSSLRPLDGHPVCSLPLALQPWVPRSGGDK